MSRGALTGRECEKAVIGLRESNVKRRLYKSHRLSKQVLTPYAVIDVRARSQGTILTT